MTIRALQQSSNRIRERASRQYIQARVLMRVREAAAETREEIREAAAAAAAAGGAADRLGDITSAATD